MQPSLLDAPLLPAPETYTGRVGTLLMAHRNQWVDGLEIAKVGGAYAWRSRLSDLRKFYGWTVENRQRRQGRRVISEYRLVV